MPKIAPKTRKLKLKQKGGNADAATVTTTAATNGSDVVGGGLSEWLLHFFVFLLILAIGAGLYVLYKTYTMKSSNGNSSGSIAAGSAGGGSVDGTCGSDDIHKCNAIIPIPLNRYPQVVPPVYPSRLPDYPLRNYSSYQQVGVLVLRDEHDNEVGTGESANGRQRPDPVILPLFGRKQANRDRWDYYTASDKYHMMRLPVMFERRSCDDEVGCNEIYNDQLVMVPDYGNKEFVARIYKYNNQDSYRM